MARQRASVKINQFVGGFITEANPLSFPINSNLDEENFDILEDGSRKRRLGFDVEDSYTSLSTGIFRQDNYPIGRSQFRWKNAGNDPSKTIVVVQIGNYLGFHDLDSFPLSGNRIFSTTFDSGTYSTNYSYAVVDGILVVATGEKQIYVYEYDGSSISESTKVLYIRDLFGVEASDGTRTLTDVDNLEYRPSNLTSTHLYNLRNQSYALPWAQYDFVGDTVEDPLKKFNDKSKPDPFTSSSGVWPSNADQINPFLYNNAVANNPDLERYDSQANWITKPETNVAPKGFFIIDALERGQSRITVETELRSNNPELVYSVSSLPNDSTPNGPSVLASYAGRVWYAGFSGEVISGDSKSPKMSSYVLFSQIVNDPEQLNRCYQLASPTSNVDANLVDTDGGFVKIEGAYNIRSMVNIQSSLFIFAENGVWEISGIDRNTFTATSFRVNKISREGCVSGNTVVVANDVAVYWSNDSINLISRNEFGDWVINDLTEKTIRTFYNNISLSTKKQAVGYYDPSRSVVRWLYGTDLNDNTSQSKELILNFKYESFLKNSIATNASVAGPVSVSGGSSINVPLISDVTVNGVQVTENSIDVTVEDTLEQSADPKQFFYCIVTSISSGIDYTFGGYINSGWKDWNTFTGSDAAAYIVTAPNTLEEARLTKDVPYLTVYFKHTGDQSTSSCLYRSRWDWTTDATPGKWSSQKQAYRPRTIFSGDDLLATRNRIRGSGRALSFRFDTEADKDLRIYGWDHNMNATTEE